MHPKTLMLALLCGALTWLVIGAVVWLIWMAG
jgi:hypothetical protein